MKTTIMTLAATGVLSLASAVAQRSENGIIVQPVPETVSTIGVLGLALIGLAALWRRFRK
jgi:LPXTG-motif cell wall-anchored protein